MRNSGLYDRSNNRDYDRSQFALCVDRLFLDYDNASLSRVKRWAQPRYSAHVCLNIPNDRYFDPSFISKKYRYRFHENSIPFHSIGKLVSQLFVKKIFFTNLNDKLKKNSNSRCERSSNREKEASNSMPSDRTINIYRPYDIVQEANPHEGSFYRGFLNPGRGFHP